MLKSFRKFADVLVRCWKNTTSAYPYIIGKRGF